MRKSGVTSVSDEEIERLASRLAMLVSDDGEADNAGRAVGTLARRLGLSGGQLKAIFLQGVAAGGLRGERQAEHAARIDVLEREVTLLRDTLRKAEVATRALQRDRDSLRGQAEQLTSELDGRRAARRGRVAVVLAAMLAVGGAVWLAGFGPRLRVATDHTERTATGEAVYHYAFTRDDVTKLHLAPDAAAPVVATLAAGTRMSVRKMLWHNLEQWVEVEVKGVVGYVPSTVVDLS